LVAATVLWLVASAIDRRTEVTIENLGHHLRFAVAGTEIVVPETIHSVKRITLWTSDSVDPPGVLRWALTSDDELTEFSTPLRFPRTSGDPGPVGDWWVDERCKARMIAEHAVDLETTFELRLSLRGRFTNELTLGLVGEPTVFFSLRRGLLDNYLAIRRSDGTLVDVTTLDPTPSADLPATAAQLLRAIAAACLVIAFVGLVATFLSDREGSATKPRAEGPSRDPPSRLALLAAFGLAGIGAAISTWVAIDVLGGLPHQIDEVVYLLQGRWLLDGEVAPAASAIQENMRVPFTYLVEGRWIGHYPIGWPFLLAGGLAVDAPHLVSPFLGALFVVLLFLVGREIDDDLTGLAAAVLAVVSPLARLLCGSMFPHAACAVLVLLALWLLLLSRRLPGWWFGAGAGAALGCCLAVRPMTAVAVSLVFGGWLVFEALSTEKNSRSTWSTLASAVGAGLLTSIPTLAHNAAVTGKAFSLPYSFAKGTMYALDNLPFGIRNLDAILVSASSSLTGWGWPLLPGGLALALPLAFLGIPFLLRRARREDWLLLTLLVIVALGHLPTKANGLHGYGARYLFDLAACFYLLSARGFRELGRWPQPSRTAGAIVVALFLALNLTALAVLPTRLALYRGYYDVTGGLEKQLAATGFEEAVILIEGDDWEPWGEAARLMTGPRRHAIIIGADLGDNSVITRAYPGRPVLRWDGDDLLPEERGTH